MKPQASVNNIISMIQDSDRPLRIAVTGGRHVGKTTALCDICLLCLQNHLDIAGFVENAVFHHDRRLGYEFKDICTHETCMVAQRLESGGYHFLDEAWQWAEQRVIESESHAVLIIDELGRLEAQYQGIMPALCISLRRQPRHLIAAVRDDALFNIESYLGRFDEVIFLG